LSLTGSFTPNFGTTLHYFGTGDIICCLLVTVHGGNAEDEQKDKQDATVIF